MTTGRITIQVDETLHERLETVAQAAGKTESEIVREALEYYLQREATPRTCYEMAKKAGVIGCVKGGPTDVSTNPKHMRGFGRD